MRTTLDNYLDGDITPGERAQIERQINTDPALARLLASMKHERALRAAAYASFEPTHDQARNLASQTIESLAASRPAGYLNLWVKRTLAAAAAIAIVAGSFAIGRITASPSANPSVAVTSPKTETQVVYRVLYLDENGEKEIREFASLEDANDFVNKLDPRHAEPQVAAVDLSSPGSF